MARRRDIGIDGILVVDKPRGPTSHDVVARARRALGTRAVGHAGTLDPMATGVLVVAVGEATKLVRWLTADAKTYRASVTLGAETDTLDAEGSVVERAPVPSELGLEQVRAVAAGFVGPLRQRPPAFSAIKVDGRRLHELARRGETVEVPERDVVIHRLEVFALEGERVELEVEASKGFYVRSLARDLARALGSLGHLSALRRTRSGSFTLEGALDGAVLARAAGGDEAARTEVRRSLLPLVRGCAGMPKIVLDEAGVRDARHGRPIDLANTEANVDFELDAAPLALVDIAGSLIAIGGRHGDRIQVIRGLRERS